MRTYIIYCEPCGFKKLVTDPHNVGLRQYLTSPVQGRLPSKKLEEKDKKPIETMPKFKCPQCGRVVTMRKSNTPQPKPPEEENKNEKPAE